MRVVLSLCDCRDASPSGACSCYQWECVLLLQSHWTVYNGEKFLLERDLPNHILPYVLQCLNSDELNRIIACTMSESLSSNFQHIALWIFSHEKASIHSHNSHVSTTKFSFQEFSFCMKLPSKEFSICNHIFRVSSMKIYKLKAIISIKLF